MAPIENPGYNFDCLRLFNNSIMYFHRKDSMNQSDQNNWKVTIIAIFSIFFAIVIMMIIGDPSGEDQQPKLFWRRLCRHLRILL